MGSRRRNRTRRRRRRRRKRKTGRHWKRKSNWRKSQSPRPGSRPRSDNDSPADVAKMSSRSRLHLSWLFRVPSGGIVHNSAIYMALSNLKMQCWGGRLKEGFLWRSFSTLPEWRTPFFDFEILHQSRTTGARVGRLHTPHGRQRSHQLIRSIDTPNFVPVATNAVVKTLHPELVEDIPLLFCNTLHLSVSPGPEVIEGKGPGADAQLLEACTNSWAGRSR